MTRAASAALGDWNPKPATLNMIGMAAEHIDRLHAEGYTPTLRQIYYQMVRSNQIANSERSYKNLGNALNQARWAGMIDIYALDDLGREAVQQRRDQDEENFGMLEERIREMEDDWKTELE